MGAHPRSRGENGTDPGRLGGPWGSSPLTRGKPHVPRVTQPTTRLIPAHAGKTLSRLSTLLRARAHPRSRGENSGPSIKSASPWGSSPLTRGKHSVAVHRRDDEGLIPAHAGKTGITFCIRFSTWAHPRSRGENEAGDEKGSTFEGSSPLTRGKRRRCFVRTKQQGLIPAHAGKTKGKAIVSFDPGAHPRSRGENQEFNEALLSLGGSSPLTRGKPKLVHCYVTVAGLIPAHAGKTS